MATNDSINPNGDEPTDADTFETTSEHVPGELTERAPFPLPEVYDISTLVHLHPNLLAQLDAAFRRHWWLAMNSGVGALLDRHCRATKRGRKKDGLDGAIYYALQLTAVFASGQATIKQMYVVSRSLPLDTRREFGLVVYNEKGKTRELTRRQLDTMTSGLKRNLSYNDCLSRAEKAGLPQDEQETLAHARRAQRQEIMADIVARLIQQTLLIPIDHGTYAIDDTAIWCWSKAPHDKKYKAGGIDRPMVDEDLHPPVEDNALADVANAAQLSAPEIDDQTSNPKRDPQPWLCPDAQWGGKTSKGGTQVGVYGYKAHVIVNTNDPDRRRDLPILIQAMELTPANADIVDVSLRLIDQIRARAPFTRLVGDRHYGYKKLDRWAMELWKRRVHQVLDLRADKPGPVDVYGAKVIDGRPHCPGMAAHLERLVPSDDAAEQEKFHHQIDYRQQFAFRMLNSPLASARVDDGADDPKVGITRWECPAMASKVGCPLRPDSLRHGRPRVPNPPTRDSEGNLPKCCTQGTIQIRPVQPMKYLQQEYWGSRVWTQMYALRSAVEGVFGNIKNRGTEDVRRGFTQITGLPLVTLGVAAAAACYNIRIVEKYTRESGQKLDHPLMNHPREGELIESILLRGEQVTAYIASEDLKAA